MALLPLPYSALVDASTNALLTLTQRIPIIVFLAKTSIEAEHMAEVNYPNYLRQFKIASAHPATFPEWSWNPTERLFLPTPKALLTKELRERSLLAIKKSQALYEVMRGLTVARGSVSSGLIMQETIYITKKMQAQRFKDHGYPEDTELEFPYVLQYADFAGLTMRVAADEILLKARLDDEMLLKTEYFRLKYFNLIKKVSQVAEVDQIRERFLQEFYWRNRG